MKFKFICRHKIWQWCGKLRLQKKTRTHLCRETDILVPLGYYLQGRKKYYRNRPNWMILVRTLVRYCNNGTPFIPRHWRKWSGWLNSRDKDFSRLPLHPNCSEARLSYQICTGTRSCVGNHLSPPSKTTAGMLQSNPHIQNVLRRCG